jgi:YHS domain-containing protein
MRIHGRLWVGSLAVAAAAILAGCGGTVSVVSEGDDANLMLRGNDAVAYFTAGRALPGRSDIKTDHHRATYRFASEESKRQFITNPERYAPQFGGFCAQSMAYAIPVAADAGTFKIIDGKLYLFASPRARLYFEMDQERNLKLATSYWESEVMDTTNWRLQAWKRLLFRVPAYRSDSELAAEYEKRFSKR